MNAVIWWFDVMFEIQSPREYAGKRITFPIEPGSTRFIIAQMVYKIRLPLSVIQGKPNALGYYFNSLERTEANSESCVTRSRHTTLVEQAQR